MTSKVDNRLNDWLSANRAFAQTWQIPPDMSQWSAAARQRGAATMICLSYRFLLTLSLPILYHILM